jgi:hypothetical protein
MSNWEHNLNDYVTVDERIQQFWTKYPEGSIQTELVRMADGRVVFQARCYRSPSDQLPVTGYAAEDEQEAPFAVERCETSAIGRALANMGFKTRADEPRASREEMERLAERRAAQAGTAAPAAGRAAPARTASILDREKRFGQKHQGLTWRQICAEDPDYVRWVIDKSNALAQEEKEELEAELARLETMGPVEREVYEQGNDLPF